LCNPIGCEMMILKRPRKGFVQRTIIYKDDDNDNKALVPIFFGSAI